MSRVRRIAEEEYILVVLLAGFGLIFLLVFPPALIVNDSWLNLMAGREVIENGLPTREEITVYGLGATWTDQQWLAQVVFYGAHELAGMRAVVLLDVLLVLLALAFATATARTSGASSRSTFLIGSTPVQYSEFRTLARGSENRSLNIFYDGKTGTITRLSIKGVRVVPVPVWHGEMPVLGFRFGDFAYLTDCNRIEESSLALVDGVDTLVIDALRDRPHVTHFSVSEALEVIARLKPRRAYMTHMTHDLGHAATSARLPAGVELAYDGLVLDVRVDVE